MKLHYAPHPVLRRRAEPFHEHEDLRGLMDAMLHTLFKEDGWGLAAPQIGVSKRLMVIDTSLGQAHLPPQPQFFVNPEILWLSDTLVTATEGCLSVPGVWGEVKRPDAVRLRYQTPERVVHEELYEGHMARAVQHEYDHLEGRIYLDHMPAVKKQMLLRKSQQYRKIHLS